MIPGEATNLKVTYPQDLDLAETILAARSRPAGKAEPVLGQSPGSAPGSAPASSPSSPPGLAS